MAGYIGKSQGVTQVDGYTRSETDALLDDINVYDAATDSTGFFALPRGTTAQRPVSPANGYVRYNTTENYIEEYRNGAWRVLSDIFTATGGTETTITDGGINYKVHTFTSSGTFTVTSGIGSVEYLVIAGGGSGGSANSSFAKVVAGVPGVIVAQLVVNLLEGEHLLSLH